MHVKIAMPAVSPALPCVELVLALHCGRGWSFRWVQYVSTLLSWLLLLLLPCACSCPKRGKVHPPVSHLLTLLSCLLLSLLPCFGLTFAIDGEGGWSVHQCNTFDICHVSSCPRCSAMRCHACQHWYMAHFLYPGLSCHSLHFTALCASLCHLELSGA